MTDMVCQPCWNSYVKIVASTKTTTTTTWYEMSSWYNKNTFCGTRYLSHNPIVTRCVMLSCYDVIASCQPLRASLQRPASLEKVIFKLLTYIKHLRCIQVASLRCAERCYRLPSCLNRVERPSVNHEVVDSSATATFYNFTAATRRNVWSSLLTEMALLTNTLRCCLYAQS